MPQLDIYLVFSEISQFALFLGVSYFFVYYAVARLHIGLRTRWAITTHQNLVGNIYHGESRAVLSAHRPLERLGLDLVDLQKMADLESHVLKGLAVLPIKNNAQVIFADNEMVPEAAVVNDKDYRLIMTYRTVASVPRDWLPQREEMMPPGLKAPPGFYDTDRLPRDVNFDILTGEHEYFADPDQWMDPIYPPYTNDQ